MVPDFGNDNTRNSIVAKEMMPMTTERKRFDAAFPDPRNTFVTDRFFARFIETIFFLTDTLGNLDLPQKPERIFLWNALERIQLADN